METVTENNPWLQETEVHLKKKKEKSVTKEQGWNGTVPYALEGNKPGVCVCFTWPRVQTRDRIQQTRRV